MKLADIRREIDRLDQQLLEILGRRFELVRLLGELKAGADMQVRDAAREASLLRARRQSGRRFKLDQALVSSLFREILKQSVRVQSLASSKRRRTRTDDRRRTRGRQELKSEA